MSNLKSCPFCGGSNLITEPNYLESYVRCQGCHAEGPLSDYEGCEDKWNDRAGISLDIAGATISTCNGAGGGSGAGFYGGGGGGGVPINAFDKTGLKPKEYFEKQGYEVTEDHFGNGEAYDKNMNVVASWSWSE